MTLVEYGSYICGRCRAVHEVIAKLRNRFGDRLRYIFRHRPPADGDEAQQAAKLAEYAAETLLGSPDAYSWCRLSGAGALAGIGFTMSLFIASQGFPDPRDYPAAKFAIFLSSFLAGGLGLAILWEAANEGDSS